MRFARSLFILTLLITALVGALILTRRLHPVPSLLPGDLLFPILPDRITTVTWDLPTDVGVQQPVTLERKGEFWYMTTCYPGMRCDTARVATLLDNIQDLKVAALITPSPQLHFQKARQLVVGTPERQVSCDFSEVSQMEVSQLLASYNDTLITVDTEAVKQLPISARDLWSAAILPVSATQLTSIEWRAPQRPFTKAIQRESGAWSVTQPFAFEPNPTQVAEALRALTAPNTIATYVRPSATESALPALVETALVPYGLDEEAAIRVTIRAKGFSDPFQLRFGSPDPAHPGHVYCLIDGRMAVVSVPEQIRDIFTKEGPFATNHLSLPILNDVTAPESVTIRGQEKGELTTLTLREGQWILATPVVFPADEVAVKTLLQKLSGLSGDLVELQTFEKGSLLCSIQFTFAGKTAQIEVHFYLNAETQRILAHRVDTNRFYSFSNEAFPDCLRKIATLNQTLLDRTILSLSEQAVRRIIVEQEAETQAIVAWHATTQTWNTEFPRGCYAQSETITAWLAAFANLKALEVLTADEAPMSTTRYNFNQPHLKITLDLDGGKDGLRKVLLIAPPQENTPLMVQGRPLIYTLNAETIELLQRPLTTAQP